MSSSVSPTRESSSRALDLADTHYNAESPRKRRKYIPGGPGGGGRFEEVEVKNALLVSTRRRDAMETRESSPPAPTSTARLRREKPPDRPTFDSAAAAAAAAAQADGYKPREEKAWDEFHPDLDIDADLVVFSAMEVDGGASRALHSNTLPTQPPDLDDTNPGSISQSTELLTDLDTVFVQPLKRRPGRPPRRPESMLSGLGSPPAPRIVPLPAQNPKERLNLPKPSFRRVDPFATYEADRTVQVNYVDRTMAHAGFQESEIYVRPEKQYVRLVQSNEDDLNGGFTLESDGWTQDHAPIANVGRVEYDMDEQDAQWLDAFNVHRKLEEVETIKPAVFEITMTQIEKEWHALEHRIPKPNPKPPQTQRPRSNSTAAVNGEPPESGEEQDSKCTICDDGDCENTNAIVFCDGCDLAVHQECYGVPFIPEGQWLCRKCQLIGRAVPTCIFCPNTEGAFKLTAESKWAHLICAIWIPEVSLGNTTFMEPVMDVVKVPKQRWRLTCYLCHQKTGACIQCGNRNCFQAFHVTCARRAKLYLKMKSTHGGPANLDASVLKALCDKHVPSEWRREHDVDRATAEAKSYFRYTMRGRRWADSQQSALSIVNSTQYEPTDTVDDLIVAGDNATTPGKKRKQAAPPKNMWRLPSGAPIVPQVVFTAVETAMQRFSIRKRKEYVAEACKYWTLKREARRGAALLKRLQLQMEIFSSSELTRRDFANMGSTGRPRLQRRIEFAETLQKDMLNILQICNQVKAREEAKTEDVELLKNVVDAVYFPIPALLRPILAKAQSLDTKRFFSDGFQDMARKLNCRAYTSTISFASDFGKAFQQALNPPTPESKLQDMNQADVTATVQEVDLREVRKLAKRIAKAVQSSIQDAFSKESALASKSVDRLDVNDLIDLEALLDQPLKEPNQTTGNRPLECNQATDTADILLSTVLPQDCYAESSIPTGAEQDHQENAPEVGGSPLPRVVFLDNAEPDGENVPLTSTDGASTLPSPVDSQVIVNEPDEYSGAHMKAEPSEEELRPSHNLDTENASAEGEAGGVRPGHASAAKAEEPLTPPMSDHDLHAPFSNGGVPWYVEQFDIEGTTVHEERWTEGEFIRGMSDELSEIDDKDLQDMGDVMAETPRSVPGATIKDKQSSKKVAARKRKRTWRGYH